jgi:beta-lactamase regulating signal transducer with metallopeptidase domain
MRRQLERAREMACDEAVTTLLLKPQAYARSILQIATAMTQTAGPGYTLGIFEGGVLEDRIRRVLQKSAINIRRARWSFALALSSVAIIAVLASGFALTAPSMHK